MTSKNSIISLPRAPPGKFLPQPGELIVRPFFFLFWPQGTLLSAAVVSKGAARRGHMREGAAVQAYGGVPAPYRESLHSPK